MTTMALNLPRSGDTSMYYSEHIKPHESARQEEADYFSASFEFVSRFGIAALMCASLSSGTMNGLTKEGLNEVLCRNRANLIRHSVGSNDHANKSEEAETRTITEQLLDIRKAFGLNTSDLASLLGVSRPTLYTWLDGQEPRPDATIRIIRLIKVADEFANIGLRRPDNLVKRPLFENGDSLFSLLQQGKDIRSRFEVLRSIDEKEAASRRKVRGSGQSLRSLDEVATESVPLYSE